MSHYDYQIIMCSHSNPPTRQPGFADRRLPQRAWRLLKTLTRLSVPYSRSTTWSLFNQVFFDFFFFFCFRLTSLSDLVDLNHPLLPSHPFVTPANSQSMPISCTAVLYKPGHSIISHLFSDLVISTLLITQRTQRTPRVGVNHVVQSVMLCTLLAAIRHHIPSQPCSVPEGILNIVGGLYPLRDFTVATSRVPVFDQDHYQDPLNGYRFLGNLATFPPNPTSPPTSFDHRQELLAMHRASERRAVEKFMTTWGPTGINEDYHFIILFAQQGASSSGNSSPFGRGLSPFGTISTGSRSSSPLDRGIDTDTDTSPIQPSPMCQNSLLSADDNPFISDGHTSPSLFSITSGATSQHSLSNGSAVSLHQEDSSLSVPHVPQDADIPTICRSLGVADDIITKADWLPNGSVFDMAIRYQAMTQILRALGIDDPKSGRFVMSDSCEFVGEQILASFRWSSSTYSKKASWFNWADRVAKTCQWIGPIPGQFQFPS